jgi:hypothetical protein
VRDRSAPGSNAGNTCYRVVGSDSRPSRPVRVVAWDQPRGVEFAVKKVLELVLCILHPIAVILIWINLVTRTDLGLIAKLTWAIASIIPFVPFVYVLTGNDFL